ncbi:glycosyltransferase family 9 protein [Cellulophaga sp. Hel_I_12]|uniref:glycosyltransferase family 9 protein n=1 Tax=Cellulophaga sp. Hel_I_12 TaxID=1249972 RepID=UPI00064769AE|nr:glycosyltransferase family 9 protein [Cellulophaga sp. Hel_I_12]
MVSQKHLLVIRMSAMGDVAMTVPVLLALQKQHPDLKITVLTRAFFKPLFSQLPNVQIFEADVKGKHKGIFGLYQLYKELKALKIDAVADVHNVLRSNILKLFFTAAGIPVAQIDKGRSEKKALTAVKNKKFSPLKTTHQRYSDVFSSLGFKVLLEETGLLTKESLSKNTQDFLGSDTKKRIGIAPFAAFSGKMYPLQLMEQVVENLAKSEHYQIVLFGGGPKEKEALELWQHRYKNTLNVAGKFSFQEELSIISQLDLMLAMDSGNAHLAANYGIPVVTLWGVTHPYAGFYPFRQPKENALLADRNPYPLIPTSIYGNTFPEGYEKVMETIRPASIIAKIEEIVH